MRAMTLVSPVLGAARFAARLDTRLSQLLFHFFYLSRLVMVDPNTCRTCGIVLEVVAGCPRVKTLGMRKLCLAQWCPTSTLGPVL